MTSVVVLDSDTLSELSRGNPKVRAHAAQYLQEHGALTITAVSVFERLRGYRTVALPSPVDADKLAPLKAAMEAE